MRGPLRALAQRLLNRYPFFIDRRKTVVLPITIPGKSMGPHVLIVEDEPILAKNIGRFLARRGYATTAVASVDAALVAVRHNRFDIVLLDIELPDGNGLEAYPMLCQTAPLPAVAMTGCPRAAYRTRARQLCLGALLTKPFSLTQLAQHVEALAGAGWADGRSRCPATARPGPQGGLKCVLN